MNNRICFLSLCVTTVLTFVVRNVVSFNIEQTESGVQYLPENTRNMHTSGEEDREGSFYGNQVKITKDARILISSPKWTAATSRPVAPCQLDLESCVGNSRLEQYRGAMSICEANFTNRPTTSCWKALRPTLTGVTRFGSKLENNGGVTWACSPTDVLQCDEDNFRQPGVCYQSNDTGMTWDWLKDGKSQCPVSQQKLDIIFVLDGSYSVKFNFEDIKTWTQNMASKFDIQKGINQIGVVQFSSYEPLKLLENQDDIKTEVSLGQHKTNRALRRAIGKIKRHGLSTHTAHGMKKTVNDFMKGSRWSDNNTQKVMVVLTDGHASDSRQLPSTADYVRSLGIITFAVGVGYYDMGELRTIATGNSSSSERVLSVDTFSGLESIVKDLSNQILEIVLEGSGNAKTASYKMDMAEVGFSMESTSVR